MIWVKISGAPGNVTQNPIPIQLGKGYVCRARYQDGRMLPQDHAKGTDSWWMVNPSSGLGVLQDPSDEGEGERESPGKASDDTYPGADVFCGVGQPCADS